MSKNENPFAIRKSPVEIISAQAISLDDYVKRGYNPICGTGKKNPTRCSTGR